ncbi:transposase (fragment) [Thiocapsa sp. KS1]
MLAPNAPLRLAATAYARDADPDLIHPPPVAASPPPSPPAAAAPSGRSPARYPWALLIARLFLTLPLVCPNCGADMRIVAFSTEAARCGGFSWP